MSEGPQVKLRSEWLNSWLQGKQVMDVITTRKNLRGIETLVGGHTIAGVTCKGKHIFIEFERGIFLHNHLLMRGRWKKEPGQIL